MASAELSYPSSKLVVEAKNGPRVIPAIKEIAESMGYSLGATRTTAHVGGMDCPDCAVSLEKGARSIPGVSSATVDYAMAKLTVEWSEGAEVMPAIQELAVSMGYTVGEPQVSDTPETDSARSWLVRHPRQRNTILGGLLMLAGFLVRWVGGTAADATVLFSAAIIVAGAYVARAGWAAVRTAHNLDMNVLMTIAAIGAVAVGEAAEGAMAIVLFSVGELLESYSADRARRAVRELMDLAPEDAILLTEDGEERVAAKTLHVDDRVLVRPGGRLPADGQIIEGQSSINEAPITGESVPVTKTIGDDVFAGTINGRGALIVNVTRGSEDTTIARILRLVEEAQSQRAPAQRFVERFARVYTPVVIALAAGIALLPPLLGLGDLGEWVYRALVLLVIACPCALVISTPVTIVSALARAARAGVLIKGGRYLEQLASIRVVAFDKTGTLTEGKPRVIGTGCETHPELDDQCIVCEDLLAKAAAVEVRSEHALGQAVVEYARDNGLVKRHLVDAVAATTGMGIEGLVDGSRVSVGSHAFSHRDDGSEGVLCDQVLAAERDGNTVLVVRDEESGKRCYLKVADALRPHVQESLRGLRRAGVERIVMLTGDNPHTAERIAEKAGVDEFRAQLLPEDKVDAIDALQEKFGGVAMVGDGVNDAPALARASVGIAMGVAGTDAALEIADVALMSDDLRQLPFLLQLSQSALRIVRTNIVFALALKALFLGLAAAGLATMWMAVVADVGGSILVTLNGLRMLAYRGRDDTGPGLSATR